MTHEPPSFTDELGYGLGVNVKGESCGCKVLGDAAIRAKPRLHSFGHVHEGRGAVKMQWSEKGNGNERVKMLPDDGRLLSVSKERERTRSVLVNAAVWGETKGWTIDLEV